MESWGLDQGWLRGCWKVHLIRCWEGQDRWWGLNEGGLGWCWKVQLLFQAEDWGRGWEGRVWLRGREEHGDLMLDEVGDWDGQWHWAF